MSIVISFPGLFCNLVAGGLDFFLLFVQDRVLMIVALQLRWRCLCKFDKLDSLCA